MGRGIVHFHGYVHEREHVDVHEREDEDEEGERARARSRALVTLAAESKHARGDRYDGQDQEPRAKLP